MHRSMDMWHVGYYLSAFGQNRQDDKTLPPKRLATSSWKHCYAIFFNSLGEGRTLKSFQASLKNARDTFDGHVDSGRVGWRVALRGTAAKVVSRWSEKTEDEVWGYVSQFADLQVSTVSDTILDDLMSELTSENSAFSGKTEGNRREQFSLSAERNPVLRQRALQVHGTDCMVCGFSFGRTYGRWGLGYAVVHHLILIADGERITDPSRDLAVVCANCHAMIHRRQGVVLTIDELRAKISISPR